MVYVQDYTEALKALTLPYRDILPAQEAKHLNEALLNRRANTDEKLEFLMGFEFRTLHLFGTAAWAVLMRKLFEYPFEEVFKIISSIQIQELISEEQIASRGAAKQICVISLSSIEEGIPLVLSSFNGRNFQFSYGYQNELEQDLSLLMIPHETFLISSSPLWKGESFERQVRQAENLGFRVADPARIFLRDAFSFLMGVDDKNPVVRRTMLDQKHIAIVPIGKQIKFFSDNGFSNKMAGLDVVLSLA